MKYTLPYFLFLLLFIKPALMSMQNPLSLDKNQTADELLFELALQDTGTTSTLLQAQKLIDEGAHPHYVGKRMKAPRLMAFFGPIMTLPGHNEYEDVKTSSMGKPKLKQLLNQPCQKIK